MDQSNRLTRRERASSWFRVLVAKNVAIRRDADVRVLGRLSLLRRAPRIKMMNWQERISLSPDVRSGKPCIKGTRITVYDLLEYLAGGMSEDEILSDFPDLTREDIRAALAFAAARERRLANSVA